MRSSPSLSIASQLFRLATPIALGALGFACGGSVALDDGDTVASAHELRQHVPHPQGAYAAEVTASGSGCPAGTWDVGLSPDGETFTARFSAYEAMVSPGVAIDQKDCQLDINLGSSEGISFAVASFYYQGYMFLEKEGMRARQTAKYNFAGLRENDADKNEVAGPVSDSYVFSDEIAPPRREWTRCRRNDSLRVKTRLVMKNDPRKTGEGYINTATLDGSLTFRWSMKWRRCEP
jgi:hypothetical protein